MGTPAVLLLNLGSPDSTSVPDVRRYLREFLWDERVLDTPAPLRWLILNLFILPFRPRVTAEAYAKIWTPAGSPLIATSRAVQGRVQTEIGGRAKIALAMRYGEPAIARAVRELRQAGVTRVLVVPLYPHYAMSSYETVVVLAEKTLAVKMPGVPVDVLPPFYQDPAYLDALSESIRPYVAQGFDKILFSYHGLPYRHLRKSDLSRGHCLTRPDCCDGCHPAHATCYRHQCLRTTELVAARLSLPRDQYENSFQSRLGREPWLTPYTDFRLRDLPGEGVKRLLVLCPAFVSDCLETLEEIAQRGRETFLAAGGSSFALIPCLNEHPRWIAFLRDKISAWLDQPPARGLAEWKLP
jgi:protoporphyrin/coproporphyrin ferrochelatase